MSEKPLHVRVAEALGWTDVVKTPYERCADGTGCHYGLPPEGWPEPRHVLHYDTDWAAAGPLIERFGLSVIRPDEYNPDLEEGPWLCGSGGAHGWDDGSIPTDLQAAGETPLIAICNLILALHAAGKLPK